MDIVKNTLNRAFTWVKSSPWRIAGVASIVVLFALWILVPIWIFVKIMAGILVLVSLIGLIGALIMKKADNKKMSDIIGISSLVVLTVGFLLFVYGVSLDPIAQAEMKAQSAQEQKEKDAAAKKEAKAKKQVEDLNNWFKNDYYTDQSEYYKKNNMEFAGSKEHMLNAVIKGFKLDDGNLVAIVSTNRMNAEGFSESDIANRIFGTVYVNYNKIHGNLDAIDNTQDYYDHKGDWTSPTNFLRFED